MEEEMIKGLGRLRNATILAFLVALLFLLPSVFFLPYRSLERLPMSPSLIVIAMITMVLMIIGFILAIASWIFEILGWSSMCRAGMRKFYCFTKYMVLLGPIVGFLLAIVGAGALVLEAIEKGVMPTEESLRGFLAGKISFYILPGLLVIVAVTVIAGVASLDVGLLTNTRILAVGALLYLISVILQAPALLQSPEFMGFGLASGILSIPALLLMAIGFHLARRAVPHGREEAATA